MRIDPHAKMKLLRMFSVQDERKQFPFINLMNLVRWQEKGYYIKLCNRWYDLKPEMIATTTAVSTLRPTDIRSAAINPVLNDNRSRG